MQLTSSHITDDSVLDKRCRASVETSMRFFTLDMGKVCIVPETSIFSILSRCLPEIIVIFGLSESKDILLQPSTLEGMLNTIFDADCRPFVLKDCASVLSTLDPEARSCLLAQAVAGLVSIVHRLASIEGKEITTGVLARELLFFGRSDERKKVLDRIEHSRLFHSCLMKRDLTDLILAAVNRSNVHFESPVHTPSVQDYMSDGFGWGERPVSNMGLPWGFTIMTLN